MIRVLLASGKAAAPPDLAPALEALGFEPVGVAASAGRAVALARKLRPEAVLLDAALPGPGGGPGACRTIQEQLGIPVVLASARADTARLAAARAARPRGFLAGPFSPEQAAAALFMALEPAPGAAPPPPPGPEDDLRLLAHTLAGVWLLDPCGLTVAVNQRLADMLGQEPGPMTGRHLFEFLDQADLPEAERHLERCRQGFSSQYDLRLRSAAGSEVWVICSHSPLPGPGGACRGSLLIATDITFRKFAEASLLESENRFRQLVENLSEVFWIMELESGRGLYVSPSFRTVWGRTELEFLSRPGILRESVLPEDRERLDREHARFRERGEPCAIEYRIARPDGQVRWVRTRFFAVPDDAGRPRRAAGFSEDITSARHAAQERDRLARAIEQVDDVVLITDPGGTIQYANPAFEHVSGRPRQALLGQNLTVLESAADDAASLEGLRPALAGGGTWSGRYSYRRPDGSRREVRATLAPIYDHQGRVANYVSVQRDVTGEAQLEAQLHQARKMEALGTLAGGIAHDFNNILMAIMGFSELAMAEAPDDSRLRSRLRRVLQAGERARDLVRQILAFSRRGELERTPLELAPLVKETLVLLRATLPANVAIARDIDARAGTVLADPGQIHQIVMNLCANAAYALEREGGGTITVRLGRRTLEADTQAGPAGDWVALEVTDDGPGMSAAVLERVFDPFFTTKGPGEGTGMGLAVVHGTAHGLGGTVRAESAPGQGARFTVLLPPAPADAAPGQAPAAPQQRGTERILYVDDEGAIADLAVQALGGLGYAVTACTAPREALALLEGAEPPFDLLVTDQAMPGCTGLELAATARRLRPGLPVILCTGFSRAASPEALRRHGVARMLLKPFTLPDLARAIRAVLEAREDATGGG